MSREVIKQSRPGGGYASRIFAPRQQEIVQICEYNNFPLQVKADDASFLVVTAILVLYPSSWHYTRF